MPRYERTVWYCLKLFNIRDMDEMYEHLTMNGYIFEVNNEHDVLFVIEDQIQYVETILNDKGISYEIV